MLRPEFTITRKWYRFGRRWFIHLVAANGKIVATGEPYNSYEAAKKGCKAIKEAASGAELIR